jgi:hypothetical protein
MTSPYDFRSKLIEEKGKGLHIIVDKTFQGSKARLDLTPDKAVANAETVGFILSRTLVKSEPESNVPFAVPSKSPFSGYLLDTCLSNQTNVENQCFMNIT